MSRPRQAFARAYGAQGRGLLMLGLLWCVGAGLARADEVSDVFEGFGSASTVDATAPVLKAKDGEGTVSGHVFDSETGVPVNAATIILAFPTPADGSAARQEVASTGADGAFEFPSIPPGRYQVGFVKSGYRTSSMTNFEVRAGEVSIADFPLPPLPTESSGQVMQLDAFVVEASTVGEMISALELRMDSDLQLNVMSAEDLSKYAASDVADAIKRVAGVNVVEGQFAIIRGLEDRYSSTLYNGGPIPSPDPSRQSVQLDLFPSEIVSNLVVAKTFGGALPSNSSGGAIDIVTHSYPETWTVKLKGAAGVNTNAENRFIHLVPNSPSGWEDEGPGMINAEGGALVGGRSEILGREIRLAGLVNWERNFKTAEGFEQGLEPKRAGIFQEGRRNERVITSGGLASGELDLTDGRFDLTLSNASTQLATYGALGFDLDKRAHHSLDASVFYTKKDNDIVELKEHGYLEGYDYEPLSTAWEAGERSSSRSSLKQVIGGLDRCGDICATQGSWIASLREDANQPASRGPVFLDSFFESRSAAIERDLLLVQVNGDHQFEIDLFDGGPLEFDWAFNHAQTNQSENVVGARFYYEPDALLDPSFEVPGAFPVTPEDLGVGQYFVNQPGIINSANTVDETQWFGRFDLEYGFPIKKVAELDLQTGGWFEFSDRGVDASYLETPTIDGGTQFAVTGDSLLDVGTSLLDSLDQEVLGDRPAGTRDSKNDSSREIMAWYLSTKTTLWDQLDVLAGVRVEDIEIRSENDAINPGTLFGAPLTYPPVYLCCDRLDNAGRGEVRSAPRPGTVFNDQVLGIDVPVDPATGFVDLVTEAELSQFLNGEISELKALPAVGLAYRPLEDLALRLSFSQTVARPSLRELGWYATVDLGTDDLVVGNPQLQLSDVTSVDGRVEYAWGWGAGGFGSFSGFYKGIENAIESILIRNPIDLTPDTLWRTWLNNPNDANLWGIELELRQSLGFLPQRAFEWFSIGGNFTYIDARVGRTQVELDRADVFFKTAPGDVARYSGLAPERRLFGQPEWIVNADISFEQPDWGTRATLAVFGISDVLDAAGSAFTRPDGLITSLTLDRYVDSFYQLDLTLRQNWQPNFLRGGELTFGFSVKNLTNSTRGIVYDRNQTDRRYTERAFKVGQSVKFSLTYSFSAL